MANVDEMENVCPRTMQMVQVPERLGNGVRMALVHGPCIGPRCMAWRWVPGTEGGRDEPRPGYCGLAGMP